MGRSCTGVGRCILSIINQTTIDTIIVVGGRSVGANYLLYINAGNNISNISFIGHNNYATSTSLYILANSYTVDGITINSQLIDPSGLYLYADAGTGVIRHINFAGSQLLGAPPSNGYFSLTGAVTDVSFDNAVSNIFDTISTGGATAGTVSMKPINMGTAYKKYVVILDRYENSSTTDQSISFQIPFTTSALISGNNTGLTITTSTSGIKISTPDDTIRYSGILIIEGY